MLYESKFVLQMCQIVFVTCAEYNRPYSEMLNTTGVGRPYSEMLTYEPLINNALKS
jgi:hypothetical protein